MSDDDGLQTTPYVFTIKNNGNVDYKFNIKLLSTGENTFSPEYIKLKMRLGHNKIPTMMDFVENGFMMKV